MGLFFYAQDQIGSVTAMIDTQGKIAGTALYSPYGKLLQSQGGQANIAYAGLYHHKETGFYLTTYRGYDHRDLRIQFFRIKAFNFSKLFVIFKITMRRRKTLYLVLRNQHSQRLIFHQQMQGQLCKRVAVGLHGFALRLIEHFHINLTRRHRNHARHFFHFADG